VFEIMLETGEDPAIVEERGLKQHSTPARSRK
jgi:hypothetical protein